MWTDRTWQVSFSDLSDILPLIWKWQRGIPVRRQDSVRFRDAGGSSGPANAKNAPSVLIALKDRDAVRQLMVAFCPERLATLEEAWERFQAEQRRRVFSGGGNLLPLTEADNPWVRDLQYL